MCDVNIEHMKKDHLVSFHLAFCEVKCDNYIICVRNFTVINCNGTQVTRFWLNFKYEVRTE